MPDAHRYGQAVVTDTKRGADPRSLCGVFRRFLSDPELTLEWLDGAIAAQGLRVVTAADVAVLDAAAALHPRSLKRPLQYVGDWEDFIEAEIARREAIK